MATIPRVLSYEEWLQMPTVEYGREEVVNGELLTMAPPYLPHAFIIQRLIMCFARQVDQKKVDILGSDFGLMISQEPLTCRSPDLALFWKGDMIVRDGLCWAAPALVVEVISKSETKRRKQEKLDDYARIAVPEAWIVSPKARSIEIHLLHEGKLASTKIVVNGEIQPTQFPGVSIPVAEIWPE
jgi:Uma2 family endonuclease